jgi:lipopolysaccharide transport system permease protein
MNMIAPDPGRANAPSHYPPSQSPAIVISASRNWRNALALAAADIGEAVKLWPLIWTLSLFDIKLRYRGSMLGPFWLTLSTAIMIGAIGFLYSRLFHQQISNYLPFLTISLIMWNYLNTITAEGSTCLTQSEGLIRGMRMPHSLHAARVVVRNVMVLAHNLVVILVVFLVFHVKPSFASFSLLPALLLWFIDAFTVCLLLGILGARFRDIPPIIGSVMQIAFYLTPIMWAPTMLEHRGLSIALVTFNPFFSLVEIMRGPLLGDSLDPHAWLVALTYSALLIILTGALFTRARPRIPYWI